MRKLHGKYGVLTMLALALLLGLLLAAAPAGAIVGGTPDYPDSTYRNVGINMEYGFPLPDHYGIAGSCTLVRNEPPDKVIVMCSAHQLAWPNTDPKDSIHPNLVSFDPFPPMALDGTFDAIAADPSRYVEFGVYKVKDYKRHPGFDLTPYRGYSLLDGIGPTREDVGLMWLDRQVLDRDSGLPMATATIVGLNGLDLPGITGESFTAVGYGLTAIVQGSIESALHGGAWLALWAGRQHKQLTVKTAEGAFADRYLQMTVGQMPFDSGGPLLHDGVVVAVDSFGTPHAGSGDYDYRLDTYSAQEFLSGFGLVPVPPAE